MRVRDLQTDDIPCLHNLFVILAGRSPHGFAPDLGEFAAAIGGPCSHQSHSAALVAEDPAGEIAGFARIGRSSETSRWTFTVPGEGMLLGPIVPPGRADVGTALVDEADRRLQQAGVPLRWAFDPAEGPGIPFLNGGVACVSERWFHVVEALTRHGFRVRHRELALTRMPSPLSRTDGPGPGYRLLRADLGEGQFALTLHQARHHAADCHYSRMYPHRSRQQDACRYGYIDGLGVDEAYRGLGFGRLLMCEALADMAAMGCGEVCLTTGSENYRAQNLYFSLGFAVVDSLITLERPARLR